MLSENHDVYHKLQAPFIEVFNWALLFFQPGIAAVVRTYVSEATTKEEKTGAMAGTSAVHALGFLLGPGRDQWENYLSIAKVQ